MDECCNRCGGSDVVDDLRVASSVDPFSSVPISILTFDAPEAAVLKKPRSHQLLARVCRACGHTELYLKEPEALQR